MYKLDGASCDVGHCFCSVTVTTLSGLEVNSKLFTPKLFLFLLMCVFPSLCTLRHLTQRWESGEILGPMLSLDSCWLYTGIKLYSLHACMYAKSLQFCPTQCSAMDCRPPGSSAYGILRARILEYVVPPSSEVFPAGDWTHISYISLHSRQILYCGAAREDNAFCAVSHNCFPPLWSVSASGASPLSLTAQLLPPASTSTSTTAPTWLWVCSYPHPVLLCGIEWLGPECSLSLIWSTCQGGLEKHGNP